MFGFDIPSLSGVKGISNVNVLAPSQHYGYFNKVGVGILKSKMPYHEKIHSKYCQVGTMTYELNVKREEIM